MLKTTYDIRREINGLEKKKNDKYTRIYFTSLVTPIERTDLYKLKSKSDREHIIPTWTQKSAERLAKDLLSEMLKYGYVTIDKTNIWRPKFIANPEIIHSFYRRYALTENEYNLAKDNLTYLTKNLWWRYTIDALLKSSDDKVNFIDALYQLTFLYDLYKYVPPKKVTTIDNNPSLIELGYSSKKFIEVKVETVSVDVDRVLKENPKASPNSEVKSNGKNYIKYRMLCNPSYELQNSLYTLGLSGIKVLNRQVLVQSSCKNIASRLYSDVYARDIIKKLYPNEKDNDVEVNAWIKSNINTMLSEEFMYLPERRKLIISFVKKVSGHFIKECLGEEWEQELIK